MRAPLRGDQTVSNENYTAYPTRSKPGEWTVSSTETRVRVTLEKERDRISAAWRKLKERGSDIPDDMVMKVEDIVQLLEEEEGSRTKISVRDGEQGSDGYSVESPGIVRSI